MLTPQQVIDDYYLEARYMALEIAALFDRYDAAVSSCDGPAEEDGKLKHLRRAMTHLAFGDTSSPRTEVLLELFAAP